MRHFTLAINFIEKTKRYSVFCEHPYLINKLHSIGIYSINVLLSNKIKG